MRRFKRIGSGLFIVLVIVLGIGFYLGWFQFATDRDEENKSYLIKLAINYGKLAGDTEVARQKGHDIINPATGTKSVRGTLGKIDEAQHFFILLADDNTEYVFLVPSTTSVGLKELHSGDPVTVEYKGDDGRNIAQSVTVIRKF